ncbi:MAG: hypothetical protein JF614_05445, partial [Acidobacteria bacterium]|nr:hypothetical protein [Acidobacteriota bacterium]
MKAVGDFQILQKEETGLRLNVSFATALSIREGVVLYGVALMPESLAGVSASEGADTENRLMTLIVTPFPQASWARMIRMSVTIDPRPGSLFGLIQALNRLQIFPRHVEDVTGTSFANEMASASGIFQGLGGEIDEDDPIVPSATLVLELPQPGGASGQVAELHENLHKITEDGRSSAAAIPKL